MENGSHDIEQGLLRGKFREKQLADERAREKDAKEKRRRCFDKIFQIFLVIFSFILGLLADFFHR